MLGKMKKIMFDDRYGLESASLDGTKTMTRRVSKELNAPDVVSISEWGIDDKGRATIAITKSDGSIIDVYPAYQPGEIVAVAQRYQQVLDEHSGKDDIGVWAKVIANTENACPGYYNKMFVRADLMPHQIQITNVKYERLQWISCEDCLREGIYKDESGGRVIGFPLGVPFFYTFRGAVNKASGKQLHWTTPKEAYSVLIDRISGKGTWDKNPWVFTYEYEVVK